MGECCPVVCICLPTYNAERTVAETLRSLLAQTYTNLVIKVVDNASTDSTLRIVRSFADPRISIAEGESNIGGEGNFNRCIDLATGEYTAIFHADDIYEPTMIARQVVEFEGDPEVGAVFSDARLIDESGRVIGSVTCPWELRRKSSAYNFQEVFKAILRHSNFLICPSAMLRTGIYRDEIKEFRSGLFGSSADLDVWLRVLEQHTIAILPDRLIRYRISRNQGSYAINRLRTGRTDFFKVMDYYLELDRVSRLVNDDDRQQYEWLKRRDRVIRSINLLLEGRPIEARELCSDVFSMDALLAASRGKAGAITFLTGAYLRLVLATRSLRISQAGARLLMKLAEK